MLQSIKNKKFATVLSIITFLLLAFFYEWYIQAWSANEIGAVIRVDVFIVYPIILTISIITFYLFKKVQKTKYKLFSIVLFILFWIVVTGMFKFNVLSNIKGYDVDGNRIKQKYSDLENIEKQLIGSWRDTSERKLDFTLFKDGTARSDNMKTLLYKKWHIKENMLILTEESIGNGSTFVDDYEYEIMLLNNTLLILKRGELIEHYLKKK